MKIHGGAVNCNGFFPVVAGFSLRTLKGAATWQIQIGEIQVLLTTFEAGMRSSNSCLDSFGPLMELWVMQERNEPRYITVLELPPVESPQTAVRAAIASKAQK